MIMVRRKIIKKQWLTRCKNALKRILHLSLATAKKQIIQFDKDLKSEFKDLFLSARELLLSYQGIVETKKERITTYSNEKGGICHMRTVPYGVDFGFLKGAKMQDDLGLLTGKGKAIRVLPQKELNIKAIDYYMKQAIEINSKK